MSDIFEGFGTAAEGGLLARALDPDSGAKPVHPHQPDKCLNCGTNLTGAYCHACGQQGHIHRTIGAFMHDLLHGALHFEGKLWRTLPLLAFKPGALTRRYIEGERARFVSPMALFLFSVFLMFAVFQMLGFTAPADFTGEAPSEISASEVREEVARDIALAQDELAADDLTAQQRRETLERLIALEKDAGDAAVSERSAMRDFADGFMAGARGDESEVEPATEGVAEVADATVKTTKQGTGIAIIDKAVGKWTENPSLMLYKLQANAYKFSWLLIPISIPFVWLLFFWKRRFGAYDHAIFVTYSLSFMTLLFIIVSVVPMIGIPSAISTLAILVIPPIHLYKQLRGAYSLRRISAFWRLLALSLFIWIIIALFIQMLLLLGLF
ncbi:DUF3667 domain-containing protein [Aurantiacibacter rhizosphaerae]|uniref:DUF3667 domain-containing protein n=1 Tax=Aurantiacibacter rhizosphaerae TaxID=2691582 RepID=A0A844XBL8_9SPHN|nr:DUF3667 domain-containing protein [Aurantiacibacter rhizosphaerae]MWV26905.1 DUF3667 domain-containing protein [Aurantiacibacter rhizosphaerae]